MTTRDSIHCPLDVLQSNLLQLGVVDVDYKVPILDVKFAGFDIKGALLDGGSRVNILPESSCKKLGITDFEEAPFQVRMADQR